MTVPGLLTGAMIVFSLSAGSYITPLLVGGRMQPLLPLSIYQQVMQVFHLPLAAAMSITLLAVVSVVIGILGFFQKRWEARIMGRQLRRLSGGKWIDVCVWAAGLLVYLFLALPVFVIILSAFSPDEYPKFPPSGVSLRWFAGVFSSSGWMESIWVSGMLLLVVTPLA